MYRDPQRPRFLICRLSAVGDTVHTLPLACALRSQWPGAFIGWVVEKGAAPLVQGHPAINEVFVVRKGFLKSPADVWRIAQQLRSWRFDVALDPQSLTKSAMCGFLSGARTRIGFGPPQGREFAPWLHTMNWPARQTHVVRRYLELLEPLGLRVPPADIACELPTYAAEEATISQFLAGEHLAAPLAVINPGAGWDSKIWPCERYAQVAAELPCPSVVVWAGGREKSWGEEIVAGSRGKAILAPPTTLRELTALVRRASVFVGSDTGPLHIAAAVSTPCVAIFGPTSAQVCGPFGPSHIVLQARHENLGSNRKTATESTAMLEIEPRDVVQAAETILARGRNQHKAA